MNYFLTYFNVDFQLEFPLSAPLLASSPPISLSLLFSFSRNVYRWIRFISYSTTERTTEIRITHQEKRRFRALSLALSFEHFALFDALVFTPRFD